MTASARLVTTFPAPFSFSRADDAPYLEARPGGRRLVQRGDTDVVVRETGRTGAASEGGSEVRFPAPWTRRFGGYAVAPAGDLVVFAGCTRCERGPGGAVRWELQHRCWAGCPGHATFDEYADDRDHRYASSGSAGFSADGSLVWAHTRGPLAQHQPARDARAEEWLVIDAAGGKVLARADTRTAAAGSVHVPHPDPHQMGLTIGEGQDGSPLRWGRWDGQTLSVDCFGDEDRILMAVSPSGGRLLTVTHDQDILAVHRATDGSVEAELSADEVPGHPEAEPDNDEAEVFFDYEGGFLNEDTAVVGTAESDEEFGAGRHWLIDLTGMSVAGQLTYPFPVAGLPRALGDGTWYTASQTENAIHVWTL